MRRIVNIRHIKGRRFKSAPLSLQLLNYYPLRIYESCLARRCFLINSGLSEFTLWFSYFMSSHSSTTACLFSQRSSSRNDSWWKKSGRHPSGGGGGGKKDTGSIRHTCTHDIGDDELLCFPRVSRRVTNHLPSLTTIVEQSAALNNRHADFSPFRLAHLFLCSALACCNDVSFRPGRLLMSQECAWGVAILEFGG